MHQYTRVTSLDDDGRWSDNEINYTSGCAAQRANWPAQAHWRRIGKDVCGIVAVNSQPYEDDHVILDAMAAEWYKITHSDSSTHKHELDPSQLLSATLKAADWWFKNDFSDAKCLDGGGGKDCPCGTPGLWNTNWYSNVSLSYTGLMASFYTARMILFLLGYPYSPTCRECVFATEGKAHPRPIIKLHKNDQSILCGLSSKRKTTLSRWRKCT
jgi:hypothetical protein